jgi:hypothetical protein
MRGLTPAFPERGKGTRSAFGYRLHGNKSGKEKASRKIDTIDVMLGVNSIYDRRLRAKSHQNGRLNP